jgi:hypothetical protein
MAAGPCPSRIAPTLDASWLLHRPSGFGRRLSRGRTPIDQASTELEACNEAHSVVRVRILAVIGSIMKDSNPTASCLQAEREALGSVDVRAHQQDKGQERHRGAAKGKFTLIAAGKGPIVSVPGKID